MNPGHEGIKLVMWGLAALMFGLLLVSHGCARFVGGGGHVFGAEVTEGKVVEIRKRASTSQRRIKGLVHEATVEFSTGTRAVRIDDNTGLTGATHGKGERVHVYFDPAEPEKALVGGTAPFTVTPYLFEWLAGLLVVAVAAVLMVRGAKFKREGRA